MEHDSVEKKKKFLDEFNYFRGLAIFIITWSHTIALAAGHSKGQIGITHWPFVDPLRAAVVDDSSCYFVFISGFLFYYIFYKCDFAYGSFIG